MTLVLSPEHAVRAEHVVQAEHAASTWLTGAAGLLMVAAAVVMMVIGAPSSPVHPQSHRAAVLTASPAAHQPATGLGG